MFRNPITSRTTFMLAGFAAYELLSKFEWWHWAVLIVALALLEARLDRRSTR